VGIKKDDWLVNVQEVLIKKTKIGGVDIQEQLVRKERTSYVSEGVAK